MGRLTALPATHETGAEELAALVLGETIALEGVTLEEVVKLRNQLEEVTKGKEAAIDCPRRAVRDGISVAAQEENALADSLLSGVGVRVDALDRGLRDTVEEAEAVPSY